MEVRVEQAAGQFIPPQHAAAQQLAFEQLSTPPLRHPSLPTAPPAAGAGEGVPTPLPSQTHPNSEASIPSHMPSLATFLPSPPPPLVAAHQHDHPQGLPQGLGGLGLGSPQHQPHAGGATAEHAGGGAAVPGLGPGAGTANLAPPVSERDGLADSGNVPNQAEEEEDEDDEEVDIGGGIDDGGAGGTGPGEAGGMGDIGGMGGGLMPWPSFPSQQLVEAVVMGGVEGGGPEGVVVVGGGGLVGSGSGLGGSQGPLLSMDSETQRVLRDAAQHFEDAVRLYLSLCKP